MQYINIHTHKKQISIDEIAIVNIEIDDLPDLNTNNLYSFGIHPWIANTITQDEIKVLETNCQHKSIIAIGETGLDKVRGGTFEQQLDLFHKHIELSEKLHKPLILHCVRRYNEIITLRKQLKAHQTWIFHGFNASKEILQQAVKHGFYFSYGPGLFNSKSKAVQSLIQTPPERLFLETDDSSRSIQEIYSEAEKILHIQSIDLIDIISDNFNLIFNTNLD